MILKNKVQPGIGREQESTGLAKKLRRKDCENTEEI